MEIVVELAFEGLRVVARLIRAALELLIECLRIIGRPFLHLFLETFVHAVAELCGRGWRRLHRRVERVTGLPQLSIPLAILLVTALIAGMYLAIVVAGQAIF